MSRPCLKTEYLPAAKAGDKANSIVRDWNGQDQLINVRDPRWLNTSYEVDGLGRQSRQQSPDTGTETTQFDAMGNITAGLMHAISAPISATTVYSGSLVFNGRACKRNLATMLATMPKAASAK